jgi:hypothetical protein
VVWGGGASAPARAHQRDGAEVVAWPGADPAALVRAGVSARPAEAVIGDEGLAAATAAARTWTRLWGRLPLVDGRCFRELVSWHDTSLLWLAEGFIRHETAGPRCAELAEISLRLLEATDASEVDVVGLAPPEATLLSRACIARGVLFHGSTPTARPIRSAPPGRPAGLRALGRVLAPGGPPPPPAPATTAGPAEGAPLLLIAARENDDLPLHPLLEAAAAELSLPGVIVPAVALVRWETRRARRAAAEAEGLLRQSWKRLRGAPGLLESYRHRGVGFSDLADHDLERILIGHLPAAVLRLEAAMELLSVARPAVVVLCGSPRDERRALLAACAIARIPAAVLHPGPIEPEELDRDDGGPRAAATFVWEPGSEPGPALARIAEAARARVGPE